MLTQEQVQFFRTNGFLNYGRVLSDEQLAEMREALERVLSGRGGASPDQVANIGGDESVVTQVVNVWQAEPAFRAHLFRPTLVPLVAQLMDTDTVRVWHDQMQLKPAHIGGPTVWHQDYPYWPVIAPADLVSAWVALEDATVDNGAMSMVPRSHRWGAYREGTIGFDPETNGPPYDPAFVPDGEQVRVVPCEVAAGSVVFHHCLTWHGAPPNHSERPRPAVAVHYMPGHTRYEPQGRTHLVEKHITVAPGAVLQGEHFPTVMEHGTLLSA